jgi:hypothetical protein
MPSNYTFTKRAVNAEPNQQSNFGNLQRDGSKQPMAGVLGNGFQTTDATGTPVTSPVSVTTGTVVTLNSPASAANITLTATAFTLFVSEVSGTSSLTSYTIIPVGQSMTFNIANQGPLYLLGGTGTCVAGFFYEIV